MVAMDENVRERIISHTNLISKWEIWDINDDSYFGSETEHHGGKKYYRNGGDEKEK